MVDEPTGAVRDEILLPQETVADVVDEVTDDDPGLRPRTLDEFVGQAEIKEHLAIILEAARPGASPPTTCCSPVRPAWARPPWPASSPTRWASASRSPRAPPSSGPATWPPS